MGGCQRETCVNLKKWKGCSETQSLVESSFILLDLSSLDGGIE